MQGDAVVEGAGRSGAEDSPRLQTLRTTALRNSTKLLFNVCTHTHAHAHTLKAILVALKFAREDNVEALTPLIASEGIEAFEREPEPEPASLTLVRIWMRVIPTSSRLLAGRGAVQCVGGGCRL